MATAFPLPPVLWSAAAVFAPIALLIALYYRIAEFDRSVPFASAALLLACLFAYATELLARREPRPGSASATAIFAASTWAAMRCPRRWFSTFIRRACKAASW